MSSRKLVAAAGVVGVLVLAVVAYRFAANRGVSPGSLDTQMDPNPAATSEA